MSKSKRIFVILSVVFIIIIIGLAIDIASRTTFPGKKKPQTEQSMQADSTLTKPEN